MIRPGDLMLTRRQGAGIPFWHSVERTDQILGWLPRGIPACVIQAGLGSDREFVLVLVDSRLGYIEHHYLVRA